MNSVQQFFDAAAGAFRSAAAECDLAREKARYYRNPDAAKAIAGHAGRAWSHFRAAKQALGVADKTFREWVRAANRLS